MTNGNITNLEYVYCKQKHEVSHHILESLLEKSRTVSRGGVCVCPVYYTYCYKKRALCRSTCFNKTYLLMMVAAIGHYW